MCLWRLWQALRTKRSELLQSLSAIAIREKLPSVVERVYDENLGWGILETYYTNPDGTAIIPYEFEIKRQTPENREIIYAQARDLLETLAKNRAFFYGAYHVDRVRS